VFPQRFRNQRQWWRERGTDARIFGIESVKRPLMGIAMVFLAGKS
jgi:hypothetical protein